MSDTDIIDEVKTATGIQARAHARAALDTVLDALGAMVSHPRRETIASALPPAAAEPLRRRDYDQAASLDWLVATVAGLEHVRDGSAIEHVEAVFSVLRSRLDPDLWRVLLSELPDEVAALDPPRYGSTPPPRRSSHPPGKPHRLSDARPGSEHPVAESAAHREHSHSVAATDDPHGDTKLSEARGMTQQREHESLAEGEPGFERTIAETERDD